MTVAVVVRCVVGGLVLQRQDRAGFRDICPVVAVRSPGQFDPWASGGVRLTCDTVVTPSGHLIRRSPVQLARKSGAQRHVTGHVIWHTCCVTLVGCLCAIWTLMVGEQYWAGRGHWTQTVKSGFPSGAGLVGSVHSANICASDNLLSTNRLPLTTRAGTSSPHRGRGAISVRHRGGLKPRPGRGVFDADNASEKDEDLGLLDIQFRGLRGVHGSTADVARPRADAALTLLAGGQPSCLTVGPISERSSTTVTVHLQVLRAARNTVRPTLPIGHPSGEPAYPDGVFIYPSGYPRGLLAYPLDTHSGSLGHPFGVFTYPSGYLPGLPAYPLDTHAGSLPTHVSVRIPKSTRSRRACRSAWP